MEVAAAKAKLVLFKRIKKMNCVETFQKYLEDVEFLDWGFSVHDDGKQLYLQICFRDYDVTDWSCKETKLQKVENGYCHST